MPISAKFGGRGNSSGGEFRGYYGKDRPHLSGPSVRTLFLAKSFNEVAHGNFGRDGEGTFGEKNDRPKARKTFFFITNATHNTKHGRTLNETGTARPPTELAPQSGTVEGCCSVSCFNLPSYLFYAVFLLDICESFFVLGYLLDICV